MPLVFNMEDLYHRDAALNTTIDEGLLFFQIVGQVVFGPLG